MLCDFVRMEKQASDITGKFRELRQRSGMTMDELAKALGYKGRSGIQRYEDPNLFKKSELPNHIIRRLIQVLEGKGSPPISREEIASLAGDVSQTNAQPLQSIKVLGQVAAGVWLESSTNGEAHDPVPVVPDPRFSVENQFGLIVRGNSINKFASDGDILHCVSTVNTALEPKDGDLVIVERRRYQGELIETTAKILRKNGAYELWPFSTDPEHQDPLVIPNSNSEGDEEIAIIAKVLTAHKKWVSA